VVKVQLPELSSAADIDLDITQRTFELCHEGAGYKLQLPLPYPVLSEQGSAKFDKGKKVRTRSFARPPNPPPQPAMASRLLSSPLPPPRAPCCPFAAPTL